MNMPWGYEKEPETYLGYKKRMFEKKKQKLEQLLKSINDLSLGYKDKKLLIKQLRKQASDFNLP